MRLIPSLLSLQFWKIVFPWWPFWVKAASHPRHQSEILVSLRVARWRSCKEEFQGRRRTLAPLPSGRVLLQIFGLRMRLTVPSICSSCSKLSSCAPSKTWWKYSQDDNTITRANQGCHIVSPKDDGRSWLYCVSQRRGKPEGADGGLSRFSHRRQSQKVDHKTSVRAADWHLHSPICTHEAL